VNILAKIIRYQIHDISRSMWLIIYTLFFLLTSYGLISFSNNIPKVLVSLMNITLIIIPMVSIIFGTIYLYNNKDYVVLMLSQPIKRTVLYFGLYLGLVIPLAFSFVIGISIPLILSGKNWLEHIAVIVYLFTSGVFQTIIFVSIAFLISIVNENRILGLGLSIFIWLCFAVLYDGMLLLIIEFFQDYPLEKMLIGFLFFNPIDLARILIILKLDVAALMGYTGAVFQKFFNTEWGIILSLSSLTIWSIVPLLIGKSKFLKKDF